MNPLIVYKLLLSLFLGIFIGLERETHQRGEEIEGKNHPILGIRTFTLVTTLGTIAGLLFAKSFVFFLVISAAVIILTAIYYIFDSMFTKDYGVTTEVAILYSFVIGTLIAVDLFPLELIVAITVVLVLLLSRKEKVESYTSKISRAELSSFISYAVIALVILPILPNRYFSLADIPGSSQLFSAYNIPVSAIQFDLVNPFQLWFYVALITGVQVLGYILERTIGQEKGWLLTSIAGGFVSSTATTQSLAHQSKSSSSSHLVPAAVVANASSFIQFIILIAPLNLLFLVKLSPIILLMIISSVLISLFFLRSRKLQSATFEKTRKQLKQTHLFNINPAVRFVLFFLVISAVSRISLAVFGESGLLLTSALSAIPGMDAILVSLAHLSRASVPYGLAASAFVFANAVNLLMKCAYSFFQGKREFAVKFSLSMTLVILSSIVGLLFVQ